MSSHPMRSLKSSVGSKNSSSFQPISAAGISTESFLFQQQNQSSWISRFLPNDEPHISNFSIIPPIKPPPPAVAAAASFGPFKVRETGKRAERVGGEKVGVFERKMKDEVIGEGIMTGFDDVSSFKRRSCFGPWDVGGGFGVEAARRRGDGYHDRSGDGFVSRAFQDIHNRHGNVIIPQQPGIQIRKKEAEEPFSFWNMGRFKRANFVSSVSPSFGLSSNFDRKRKPNAEDVNFSKLRRM